MKMQHNIENFITVLTSISFILVFTFVSSSFYKKLGQPKVVGEMISGVLLGPTILGKLFPDIFEKLFPETIIPFLFLLSNLGLTFYMFIVGSELNFKTLSNNKLKHSTLLSVSTLIIPMLLGALLGFKYFNLLSGSSVEIGFFMIFTGTALSITAFPMTARILQEKKLINTELGGMVMLSASIQDVVSWIILSFVISAAKGLTFLNGVYTFISALIFTGILFFVVKPLLNRIASKTEEKNYDFFFSIIIILLLICAIITDKMGLYCVFGGFMLGLVFPKNTSIKEKTEVRINDLTKTLLLPLFFTFSGLNTNLELLFHWEILVPTLIFIVVAFLGKFYACVFTLRFFGYNHNLASSMAALINARGLMELILINIGLTYNIINREMYSILVIVAIVTTVMAVPIFNYYNKKFKNAGNDQLDTGGTLN